MKLKKKIALWLAMVMMFSAVGGLTPVFAADPAEYEISMTPTSHTFPEELGYGFTTATGITFTVTNTGNQPTGELAVAINNANFVASVTTMASLTTSASMDFTVTPSLGLDIGTHIATITVSGEEVITTASVSFTVLPVVYFDTPSGGSLTATVASTTITSGAAVVMSGTVNFTATPDSGNMVSGWYVNGTRVADQYANTFSHTVTGVVTVGVEFEPIPANAHLVTVNLNEGTGPGLIGPPIRAEGTPVGINAGERAGYEFTHWTAIPAVEFAAVSSAATTFTMINEPVTLTAHWELIPVRTIYLAPSPPVFPDVPVGTTPSAITVTVINTGNQPTGELSISITGTNFEISATTMAGLMVNGTGEFTVSPTVVSVGMFNATITVTCALSASATLDVSFEIYATHIVTFEATSGGSLAATVTSGASVRAGSTVIFTASPDHRYQVVRWEVNGTTVAGNYSNVLQRVITSDTHVRVVFEGVPDGWYSVTITDGGVGATVIGGIWQAPGTPDVTVNAGTREGYEFSHWTAVSPASLVFENASDASTTFTMPNGYVEIMAHWEQIVVLPPPDYFAVTVSGSALAAGTATGQSGEGSYPAGATVTINAGSRTGYTFAGWTVSPSALVTLSNANASIATFTMPASDVHATASWTPVPPGPVLPTGDFVFFYPAGFWSFPWLVTPNYGHNVHLGIEFWHNIPNVTRIEFQWLRGGLPFGEPIDSRNIPLPVNLVRLTLYSVTPWGHNGIWTLRATTFVNNVSQYVNESRPLNLFVQEAAVPAPVVPAPVPPPAQIPVVPAPIPPPIIPAPPAVPVQFVPPAFPQDAPFAHLPAPTPVPATRPIPLGVILDGRHVNLAQPVLLTYDGTLVPVRAMFGLLGYSVDWNANTRTATLRNGTNTITITEGSYQFTVNGMTRHHANQPAQVVNGHLMVPFEQIFNAIGIRAWRSSDNLFNIVHT